VDKDTTSSNGDCLGRKN